MQEFQNKKKIKTFFFLNLPLEVWKEILTNGKQSQLMSSI